MFTRGQYFSDADSQTANAIPPQQPIDVFATSGLGGGDRTREQRRSMREAADRCKSPPAGGTPRVMNTEDSAKNKLSGSQDIHDAWETKPK